VYRVQDYFLEPFRNASLEVQKKSLILLKVNTIMVVGLLASGVVINLVIQVNLSSAVLETAVGIILMLTFIWLRTGHYTIASNVTIATLVAGLGAAGLLGYSGEVVLDFALLSFNLIPVMFYACLIGTRRYQPLVALAVCLGLNVIYLLSAVSNQNWVLDFRLGAIFVNTTIISVIAGAIAYHVMNMSWQLVGLAEQEAERLRQKSDEMQRAEERLRVTLHSIGDGVITASLDSRVTMINRVAERLTGWKADEAVGKPIQEVFNIVDEFTGAPCESPVERILKKNTAIELSAHTILVSRDGTRRSISDSGAPIRDALQYTMGVVLVFRDETETRRMEESLRKTERLESLGALAGGLAHDFNNLLCGLFGFIELARTQADKPDEVRACLNEATEVFDRARGLTKQLLTFAKGGAPERHATNLGSLLRQGVNFALSGSNVAAEFEIPEDLWTCDVDRGQLYQALSNLALNGQQATPEGGKLVVRAVNWPEGQPVPFGLEEGRYVKVSIRDEGMGIPPSVLPRIFDPFFTTKEHGNGLGLAMVHSVISQHGGQVDVTSAIGRGTTFSIYLPASEQPHVELETVSLDLAAKGSERILVVDDEDTNVRAASGLLKQLGYRPAGAHNEQEALFIFRKACERGEPFDAAILDLTIKGGPGGKDIAQSLLKENSDLKLIATSGYSHDPIMSNPAEYGFHDRLHKPFRLAELADILAKALK